MPSKRPAHPRFTERDGNILEAIYTYDGILADYQLNQLFFKTAMRTAQARLELLLNQGFITRPDRQQRAQLKGFTVYWLDKQGAEYVANRYNVTMNELKYRKPGARWSIVPHDVEINDFRIAMTDALDKHPELSLTEWIPSSVFWAKSDKVAFKHADGTTEERGVRPDSYFVIQQPGANPSRLLLEVDRATEDHPRFAREKLRAGVAYITSPQYKQRFGYNAGRWLIVTTTERRRRNMQEMAERELGKAANAYYFTTREQVITRDERTNRVTFRDVLNQPIWHQGAAETPTVLFESYFRRPL